MVTGIDWAQACDSALNRPGPLSEMRIASKVANGVAVSRVTLPGRSVTSSHRRQILAYAIAAVFCATFYVLDYRLLLWRLSNKEVDGDRVWKNLRRFSGWMFASCVAGIVMFSVNLQQRTFYYDSVEPGITRLQHYESDSAQRIQSAAFDIFYPVQLLCFIYALNTVLRRVSDHASHSYYNVARDLSRNENSAHKKFDWRDCIGEYALYYWVRSMHVIAMVGCSLYLAVRCVVAGFRAEVAGISIQAAASTDVNGADTSTSKSYMNSTAWLNANDKQNQAWASASVIEAATLVFVASGFVLFFPAIIVMFGRVEQKMEGLIMEMENRTDVGNAFLPVEFLPREADGSVTQEEMPIVEVRRYLRDIEAAAALQRRRFSLCLVLVAAALVALAIRAVFVVSFGFNSKLDPGCGPCESCQTVERFMFIWYIRSFLIVGYPLLVSLSSTLPLMFSLWLMTTPEDRAMLFHPHRFRSETISLQLAQAERDGSQTKREDNQYAERLRLGINLL
jgi:hypothetical protein